MIITTLEMCFNRLTLAHLMSIMKKDVVIHRNRNVRVTIIIFEKDIAFFLRSTEKIII